jgi:catechol 2,3-dioxygenase-like lactoylglutathione lyase family enzyme
VITVSVSIDVPSLEEGLRFYGDVFGLAKVSEPYPGVAVLRGEGAELLLLAKAAGTNPCPPANATRDYARHWTPVHVDFHVDDFKTTLAKALAAGARQEHLYEIPGRPFVAFCSDPFGHGFCLIERRPR